MLEVFRGSILLCGLSCIVWTDWNERRIPNRLLVCMLIPGAVTLLMEGTGLFWYAVLSLIIAGAVFFMIYMSFPGSMGAGDVKLAAVTGLYLGVRKTVCVFAMAFCLAAFVCAILICLKQMDVKQRVPFSPFLLAGIVVLMGAGV